MSVADVAAAVQQRRKGAPLMAGAEKLDDEDVENEEAIINDVSPAAAAALAAAAKETSSETDVGLTKNPDFAKAAGLSVPRVKAKVDVLDRSQDFGFVSPPELSLDSPPRLAHFYQNSKYFDANGSRVRMPGDEENDAKRAAELEETRKARAARLRREAEILDQGLEPETPDEDVVSAEINLTQWALFQRSYRFAEVRKAIQVRYQRVLPTEDEARNFLVDENVVTDEQLRTAMRVAMAGASRSTIG